MIRNRIYCCSNRITNWNILLYDKYDNLIASYVNHTGGYFNLNNTIGSNGLNDHLGREFTFTFDGNTASTFGLKKTQLVKKIRITRDKDLSTIFGGNNGVGEYGEAQVAVQIGELYIYGKE